MTVTRVASSIPGSQCDCEHSACEINEVHIAGGCKATPDGKYEVSGHRLNLCEYCVYVFEIEVPNAN